MILHRQKEILIYWSILLGAFMLFSSSFSAMADSNEWQRDINHIFYDYGVVVEFEKIEFPPQWDPWQPRWTAVPENKRFEALIRLKMDLARYHPDFIKKHLNKIFLVSGLSFKNQAYGGTNDHISKHLYLQYQWLGDLARHKRAMGFHHEFSSILFKTYRYQFDEENWRKANPQNFGYAYTRSLETNIQSGVTSAPGDKKLNEAGFLCPYGTLTLEDDINTFAQYLLAKPAFLENYMQQHPRIFHKVKLLSDFYSKIGHTSPFK